MIDYRTDKFEDVVSSVDVVFDTMSWNYESRSLGILKKDVESALDAAPEDHDHRLPHDPAARAVDRRAARQRHHAGQRP